MGAIVKLTRNSAFENASTLMTTLNNFETYFDQRQAEDSILSMILDISTATGFGLDILGKILNTDRFITVLAEDFLGFNDSAGNYGLNTFGNAVFYNGGRFTDRAILTDSLYRTVLLIRARILISPITVPLLNSFLALIFKGRGDAYVKDLGNMKYAYYFSFTLTPIESSLVYSGKSMPVPMGVELIN